MLATDRSISPVMTTRVSGSAISATGIRSSSRKPQLRLVAKFGTNALAITIVMTRAATSTASHEPSPVDRSRSSTFDELGATCPPSTQLLGDPHRDRTIETDRGEDQRANDRLLPEGVDLQSRQSAADGGQQQRSERRAINGAAPTEDGDAAHNGRRDDLQLDTRPRIGIQRAEPRRVQDPGESGKRAAGDEGAEDPAADRNAGKSGSVRVGADGVEVAPTPVRAKVVAGSEHDAEGDHGEQWDSRHMRCAEAQERRRHIGRVDLLTGRPGKEGAPEDVEGSKGDHERRHPGGGNQCPVYEAAECAEANPSQEGKDERGAWIGQEQLPGRERREPEDRADRKVHVSGDDDKCLADCEDRQDRCAKEQVSDALLGDEAGVFPGCACHQDGEGSEDPQFSSDKQAAHGADLAPVSTTRSTRRPAGRPSRAEARLGHCLASAPPAGEPAAAPSCVCPVAANITDSSSACSRAISLTSRPSCMTRTRSAMPRTSGSSLETITTAMPSAASSESNRCTSALVPTSMPRVGSSTKRTPGLVESHFARTTFC